MNRWLIAKEIARISGLSLVATKFKFDPENVYIDQNYICCAFPGLSGSLDELEETLKEAKEEFAKWLSDNGFLKKKGMFTSLVKSANWQVVPNANALSIAVALKELSLDKQTIKDKLDEKIFDNDEAEEKINKEKQRQEEIKKNTPDDQHRKNNGKTIMKNILDKWN